MSDLYVQVLRDGEWRTVTTVRVEPKAHPTDVDREFARAYQKAAQQLTGWSSYFVGMALRVAEKTTFGNYREVQG